ncbi:MAG: acetyl-CoA carboxylase biotin carboxyl carrier protein [Planctomycetes bacterium]|nr:acetyl-CoA carboxylase biotin carboxyl carrier protein [Planctomycetota bacterium]
MAQENSDLKMVKELIAIMKDNDLVEVKIEHGEDKLCLKRSAGQAVPSATLPYVAPPPGVTPAANPASTDAAKSNEDLIDIPSPMVGTFYEAASPDSDPYLKIGSHVSPQSVCCIIEAMKVMNEIKAEVSGTLSQILVRNGQAVEYGQILFRVKPD